LDIESKILDVISVMAKAPRPDLNSDTSMDSVSTWDSLAHLNIIIALEEEFDIELDEAEAMDLSSVPLLVIAVAEKVALT
jgi:acyl carrier protein